MSDGSVHAIYDDGLLDPAWEKLQQKVQSLDRWLIHLRTKRPFDISGNKSTCKERRAGFGSCI